MKKIYYVIAIILIAVAINKNLIAESVEKESLEEYFSREVNLLDQVVQSSDKGTAITGEQSDDEAFFFRRFWFRLRARVERDIPGLAGFSVVPEIELLWEKQVPDGWETYKIKKI